jgi:hypothetical protein
MPEQNRKSKMISLRLSAEEYKALHALYQSYGARNVSDFARLAMQRIIGHPAPAMDASIPKITELDERLSVVEGRLALLVGREKAAGQ